MTLTPSGFWVVGSEFINTNANFAKRYDRSGQLINTIVNDINPTGSLPNCGATVSSNRSGDLIITWVERNSESLGTLDCRGSIVSRIFRESGTAESDYIDVGNTRTDDIAYFGNPTSKADETGEFVVVWDSNEGDVSNAAKNKN